MQNNSDEGAHEAETEFDRMLKTVEAAPEGFTAQLQEAAQRTMTPRELREQRITFVTGMLPRGSKMSREDVAKLLDSQNA